MPSFDIVSQVDLSEVDNAVQNVMREISTRYDFKGSNSSVEVKDGGMLIHADDELKLKQVQEILRGKLHKRGIEPGQLDYGKEENCLLYTSPSPRDLSTSRMPCSA